MATTPDQEKAINMILDACEILKWKITVPPDDKETDQLEGLIIGSEKFILPFATKEDFITFVKEDNS